MGVRISVTLALRGRPERVLMMDPAEVVLIKSAVGTMLNIDGERVYVTGVPIRLGTLGNSAGPAPTIAARIEGDPNR